LPFGHNPVGAHFVRARFSNDLLPVMFPWLGVESSGRRDNRIVWAIICSGRVAPFDLDQGCLAQAVWRLLPPKVISCSISKRTHSFSGLQVLFLGAVSC
jgi:hypothetical protein